MRLSVVRIPSSPASSAGKSEANRTSAHGRSAALAIIAAAAVLAACTKADPVAGLVELPREVAARLRTVPNLPLLATTIQQVIADAETTTKSAALCPLRWSSTFYDAQVSTPITLCSNAPTSASFDSVLFRGGPATPMFKITDVGVVADLKDAELWRPPLVCATSNGPWSARMTVERRCSGTCAPQNTLFVVGVPNSVIFAWEGAFSSHPPGFEFVGTPVKTSEIGGPCNPGTGGGQPTPR